MMHLLAVESGGFWMFLNLFLAAFLVCFLFSFLLEERVALAHLLPADLAIDCFLGPVSGRRCWLVEAYSTSSASCQKTGGFYAVISLTSVRWNWGFVSELWFWVRAF
jgi:hypothetical protein